MSNPNRKPTGPADLLNIRLHGRRQLDIAKPYVHKGNYTGSNTALCTVCGVNMAEDVKRFTSSVTGGDACNNCKKIELKKPCDECFMVHEGECL